LQAFRLAIYLLALNLYLRHNATTEKFGSSLSPWFEIAFASSRVIDPGARTSNGASYELSQSFRFIAFAFLLVPSTIWAQRLLSLTVNAPAKPLIAGGDAETFAATGSFSDQITRELQLRLVEIFGGRSIITFNWAQKLLS
jgi:hypothetical protein